MHVLHHDFGGYPYPAELSRALAARGHRVTHAFCPSLETTPGGAFARREGDPEGIREGGAALLGGRRVERRSGRACPE